MAPGFEDWGASQETLLVLLAGTSVALVIMLLLEGGAGGAYLFGRDWAKFRGVPLKSISAPGIYSSMCIFIPGAK